MGFKLFVGNLAKSTTQEDLHTLFTPVGEVVEVDLYKDRKSGESNGFAFITMSAQSEADKAVSVFNTYFLSEHHIKVNLVKSGGSRSVRSSPGIEP
jgi:RNA recognition motif-containing protein